MAITGAGVSLYKRLFLDGVLCLLVSGDKVSETKNLIFLSSGREVLMIFDNGAVLGAKTSKKQSQNFEYHTNLLVAALSGYDRVNSNPVFSTDQVEWVWFPHCGRRYQLHGVGVGVFELLSGIILDGDSGSGRGSKR